MKIKISINRDIVLIWLLIFPFISINGLSVSNLQMGLICLYAFLMPVLIFRNEKRINALLGFGFLFSFVLIFSTFCNDISAVTYAVFYCVRLVVFFMVVSYFLQRKAKVFLGVLEAYIGILLLINLMFQIFCQDYFGYMESRNYANFLSADNNLPFYVLPYVCLVGLNAIIGEGKKAKVILKVLMAYMNLIMARCTSGIVTLTLCIVLLIIWYIDLLKWLDFRKTILGVLLVNYFVIWKNIFFVIMEGIFTKFFNKTLSSARAVIWQVAISNIKRSFILGYGTVKGGRPRIHFAKKKLWYSHNFILEIMVQGGIVLFALYVFLLYKIAKQVKKCSNKKLIQYICLFVGCLHILFLTEGTLVSPIQWLILCLMYYINELDNIIGGHEYG